MYIGVSITKGVPVRERERSSPFLPRPPARTGNEGPGSCPTSPASLPLHPEL